MPSDVPSDRIPPARACERRPRRRPPPPAQPHRLQGPLGLAGGRSGGQHVVARPRRRHGADAVGRGGVRPGGTVHRPARLAARSRGVEQRPGPAPRRGSGAAAPPGYDVRWRAAPPAATVTSAGWGRRRAARAAPGRDGTGTSTTGLIRGPRSEAAATAPARARPSGRPSDEPARAPCGRSPGRAAARRAPPPPRAVTSPGGRRGSASRRDPRVGSPRAQPRAEHPARPGAPQAAAAEHQVEGRVADPGRRQARSSGLHATITPDDRTSPPRASREVGEHRAPVAGEHAGRSGLWRRRGSVSRRTRAR